MIHPRLALCRVNYSQLYGVYDKGKTYRDRDILTPYQLLNLAGYIRTRGVDVRIFDGEVELMTQTELVDRIMDWRPHFVGLTSTTPDIGLNIEVCKLLKERDPSIVTIIGGPHTTAMPEETARHRYVDYVVAGDGEEPLEEIIKGRPGRSKIIRGNKYDITTQPMPAHDLLDYHKYQFTDPKRGQLNTASVMFSRGCPFNCYFCYHDRFIRYRDVDGVIAEIEYLYRKKAVRYFYIYDDTFMINKRRTKEITKKIEGLNIDDAHFQCLTRANLVDEDIIKTLKKANFARVSMGVESGSDKILDEISKGVTKNDYIKACKILKDGGIETRASFILGLPYETQKTINETIEFSKELELLHANFNIMTPYPGSKVYQMALEGDGIYFERPEYATEWNAYRRWGKAIIKTDGLSARDLEEAQLEAQTEFYSQPKILDYYLSLFEKGNRSRYFYRPLNFAWKKKYGRDVPFWNELKETEIVKPR